MSSQFDDRDFVDREFQDSQHSSLPNDPPPNQENKGTPSSISSSISASSLPTREELEAKVGDTQLRLSKLKQQQKELEEQRVVLEEARRRRKEFHDGKAEMQRHLTRGKTLLEEAERGLRRDADQMEKALDAFGDSLEKIGRCSEEAWTPDTVEMELTRALSEIENARMEWNAACLKWDFLEGETSLSTRSGERGRGSKLAELAEMPFVKLCKIGLALSLPLATIGALALGIALFGGF